MFYDFNVPSEQATFSYLKRMEELGWDAVAINYTFAGKVPRESCKYVKTPSCSLRQYTRLTIILNDPQQNAALTNSEVLRSFDMVAVRPTTERTFQIACQSLDVDVISLDLSEKLTFSIKHGLVREAVARGVMFEASYGNGISAPIAGGKRRAALSSIMYLTRVMGKAKGLIVTSGPTAGEFILRSPHCVRNWSEMVGVRPDGSKTCIVDNPYRIIRHAGDRKWSVRGSIVEIEPIEGNELSDFRRDYLKMLK